MGPSQAKIDHLAHGLCDSCMDFGKPVEGYAEPTSLQKPAVTDPMWADSLSMPFTMSANTPKSDRLTMVSGLTMVAA